MRTHIHRPQHFRAIDLTQNAKKVNTKILNMECVSNTRTKPE